MKCFSAFLAIVTLSCFTPTLRATPIAALQVGGSAATLVQTPIVGGEQYTYVDVTTNVFQTTVQTFTATFTDIAGIALLNVTDVCANVDILAPAQSCNALAFSFTGANLGNAVLLSALGTVGVNLQGNVADVNFAASIGGGSAEVGFPPPSVTPVPEPSTFGLLGTGMLGAFGAVRRRLKA